MSDTGRSTETVCRQGENLLVTREDLIGASALGLSVKWKMAHEKSRWPDRRRGLASWTMPGLWGVCDLLPSCRAGDFRAVFLGEDPLLF